METPHKITDRIRDSFARISSNERSADHSWEHCYRFFSSRPTDLGLASLHLAFYLASWGMYRGSAAIRDFDYLVHRPVAKMVLKPKYDILRGGSLEVLSAHYDDLLWPLIKTIRSGLYPESINVTDTLVTKILMGTLGCTPAYDRYFKAGLTKCELKPSFRRETFRALLQHCQKHRQGFVDAQIANPEYPIMRIIDIYFHSVGRKKPKP